MIKQARPKATGDRRTTVVTFSLPLSDSPEVVAVVGDFNGWDPHSHPLKRRSNGTRSATVELETGRSYRFKYLADAGSWFCDADADRFEENDFGESNSVLDL